MLDVFLIVAATSLFAFAFYIWATVNNDYFAKRNLKYSKPTFLVGNTLGLFLNKYTATEFSQKLYKAFPDEP